jgi:hypothetical protein
MTLNYTPVARSLRGHLPRIAVLCVALAAHPALAQEGSAAGAGADAPPAGGSPGDAAAMKAPDGTAASNRDIELVAPHRGAAGLWRRANVKTLIANASSSKAAGLPAANSRIGPPQLHPRFDFSARNAVGSPLPGARPTGYDLAGATAGPGLTAGTAAGNVRNQTMRIRAPADAGPALRGAAVNGTAMSRMAVGPGSIGGPARDHAGINGTLMRPRH